MQPTYATLSSSGSSPWRTANWHVTGPQQFSFAVYSTGGSNWQIDFTVDDASQTYPNPQSSAPTVFQLVTASSTTAANQVTGVTSLAIAATRLTLNAPSSSGAKVTLATLQTGID